MKKLFKAFRVWLFKRRLKRAFRDVRKVNILLRHLPHWKRKQFWKDFISRDSFRSVCIKNFTDGM